MTDQWKCGNEFLPYHPSASHIHPDHRDSWNACYKTAQPVIKAIEAERDAALERVKVLEAEAAKYRWMADRFLGADFDWNESDKSVLLIEFPHDAKVWGDLDMTVEAAMEVKHG